jgi:hypothetical protein
MTRFLGISSWETALAPHGGIAPAVSRLEQQLAVATGLPTVILTPYHRVTKDVPTTLIHALQVAGNGGSTRVDILRHANTFLFRPTTGDFFAGRRHPYDRPGPLQVRDALFFAVCVARSLPILAENLDATTGRGQGTWALFAQDWQASVIALAMAPNSSHRITINLHNVYDPALDPQQLYDAGIDPGSCPGPPGHSGATVFQRVLALPFVERDVFAVSQQFAAEIIGETLLSDVLTPHLRELLRGRIRGNDNGLFAGVSIPNSVLAAAARGWFAPMLGWKQEGKDEFVRALRAFVPSEEQPLWGDRERFIKAEAASDSLWFCCGGRDDFRQRGHDVLAAAVPACLARFPRARFLFFVLPGDPGLKGLAFLRRLAETSDGRVLVAPFRSRELYQLGMRGSAFGIMPSFYAPFESVHEFYLNGATPAIARAAGGLLEQLVPLRAASCFNAAVAARSAAWHASSAPPTGILYLEPDYPGNVDDWRKLNDRPPDDDPAHDRVETRRKIPLFRSMTRELSAAIGDAIRVHSSQPQLYQQMILRGVEFLRGAFSWERNAREVARVLVGDV